MILDYSTLPFNEDGTPETPELVLKTMSEETIGVIPGVSNLKFSIKFTEPSLVEFDVPAVIDGERNWIYDKITGYKIIYTEHYGVYVIMNPDSKSNGVSDIKHIEGHSIEKTLSNKKFFLEEGTFKLYNQANAQDENTIIGRILEIATGWSIGTISPTLSQLYRTFTQYDDYLLPFMYDTAKEKYRAIFVFDPYEKTISAYDADEERPTLPIYLDFDNLVTELDIQEHSEELVTALRPYGADELDIRNVNPIGSNWIYDLSYFISEGDIPRSLAEKWQSWQRSILNNQMLYKGLIASQASATARLVAANASLRDKQGEMESLKAQQSVTIQALALETTESGKEYQQTLLDEINARIAVKQSEIEECEITISEIESELDPEHEGSYAAQIKSIVNQLSIKNYFTDSEYSILSKYFIEQDVTEDTFVATSVDSVALGTTHVLNDEILHLSGSSVSMIDMSDISGKKIYILTGGSFNFTGSNNLYGDIIRGTLEVKTAEGESEEFVLSIYAGVMHSGTATASSGMLTISGNCSSLDSDVHAVTEDDITTLEGTYIHIGTETASLFLTANVSDYQKYSVEMELFDYAVKLLSEIATPTYEFSVNSGNFIFAKEFSPFRNSLKLGDSIYLNVGNNECIKPYIIEFTLDFEERNSFTIVFSNRFKRYDETNTLRDMVDKSYSASRTITTNRHAYNETTAQASAVAKFMKESINSAVNSIIAAQNQSVIIDGSGINISAHDSSDPYVSQFQMRLANGMLAMTKDNWNTVDVAIGVFKTSSGYHEGVNAHVLSGELIVGNDLIIENPTSDGIMQFKVDSSGAWLNNSTFVVQSDSGGKFILDPEYGFAAGTSSLFSVDGTTVSPTFIDNDGEIVTDADGMPQNANFYLDHRNGNAYFRGKIIAESGKFSGELDAATGTFQGDITAATGTFKGTVQAARFLDSNGNNMMSKIDGLFDAEYLNLRGLNINDKFIIDGNGNVTISGGSISWGSINESGTINDLISAAQTRADSAYSIANSNRLPSYIKSTYIDETEIRSPTIYTNTFNVLPNATVIRTTGGFSLYGNYSVASDIGYKTFNYLSISYDGSVSPTVVFSSPGDPNDASSGASVYWDFDDTIIQGGTVQFGSDSWVYFEGHVDFSYCDVTGLTATFG